MIGSRRRKTWVEGAKRQASWRLGLVVVLLLAAASYLAFTKQIPFTGKGYELHAVFRNAATLRADSPVRIAGVNVGKVLSVEPKGTAAEVTFTVSDEGQPVHADATVSIRPRLFLEGNFFLDLHPGSPSAPELPSGGTIPITDTSRAVHLDEILTALQAPNRQDLAQLVKGFGNALEHQPTPAEDATQDPSVQGKTAAQALNDSFRYGGRAGKGTAQVTEALMGTRPHDLSNLIASQSRIFGTLLSHEQQLKDLITNLNVTMGALASESTSLSAAVRQLAPTLEEAQPALAHLSDALPPLRAFAIALRPSLRPLPATIDAGMPWLRQAKLLLRRQELGGDARLLRTSAPPLARTVADARQLFPAFGLAGKCVSQVLVPTGDIVINDPFSTGQPNYRDFFYGLVNFVSAGQPFDGNGQLLRVAAGGGASLEKADQPGGGLQNDTVWGLSEAPTVGTQPVVDNKHPPPFRQDVPCYRNPVPDLNGPAAAPGAPSPEFVTTVP